MTAHRCAEYDPACEGCQPALMDPATNTPLPSDSPVVVVVRAFWQTLPLDTQRACYRVWCLGSRTPADLEVLAMVAEGMRDELAKLVHVVVGREALS